MIDADSDTLSDATPVDRVAIAIVDVRAALLGLLAAIDALADRVADLRAASDGGHE